MAQDLKFRATLDDSSLATTMRRIEKAGTSTALNIQSAFRSLISPVTALGPAVAAAFSGRAIVSGVGSIFDAGRSLRMLARETGAGVQGLAILQTKFRQAGVDGDMVGTSIFRLQQAIAGIDDTESPGGANRLRSLGLDLAALQKLSPDKQLLKVGAAISGIENVAERSAAIRQIFGRGGLQLGSVFNGPGFKDISPQLLQRAEMLARNSEQFEKASINLQRAGNVFKSFYLGTAEGIVGELNPALEKLDQANLAEQGRQFGEGITKGAKALEETLIVLGDVQAFVANAAGPRVSGAAGTALDSTFSIPALLPPGLSMLSSFVNFMAKRNDERKTAGRGGIGGGQAIDKVLVEAYAVPYVSPLSLTGSDIASNEGRAYAGARTAMADTVFGKLHNGLTSGNLSDGPYGRTNGTGRGVLTQISGRVSGGQDHVATISGHVSSIRTDMAALRKVWEGSAGGSAASAAVAGASAGGATATP